MNKIKRDEDVLIFNCPHCNQEIIVFKNELNCRIFRHAVYKKTFEQINPHMPRAECDRLKENGDIFGCGKPFQIVISGTELFATICDYI
jgi:hypothetical protein